MRQLTTEEHETVQRVKIKWEDACNGLMQFRGTVRPLLMLEFQGYLDYLKVIEKKISFWEMKTFDVNHQVGPCNFNNRIIILNATSNLGVYLPGKIGEVSIRLVYTSEKEKEKEKKGSFHQRWSAIAEDLE